MRRVFSALSWLLCLLSFSNFAVGADKTYEEYWEDLNLDVSIISESLSTTKCYESERAFLACVHAFNQFALLEGNVLASSDLIASKGNFGAVEADFGALKVVKAATVSDEETLSQLYKRVRAERQETHSSLLALFANRATETVDFGKVLTWATGTEAYNKRASYVSGTVLNTYLGVVYDPHTMVMPTAYVTKQSSGDGDNFFGIGARFRVLKKNGKEVFVIESPLEGSPSLKAGLRAHDVVTHVDGEAVDGKSLSEVVKVIKGPQGTRVTLTVNREGDSLDIVITRDLIRIDNVVSKVLKQERRKLGYVKLNSFMRESGCGDIADAVREFHASRVDGMVFDLRDNGGGLVTQANCIADLFLSSGKTIFSSKSFNPLVGSEFHKAKKERLTDLPMVTLINHRSASASEILSGTLQDNQRSFIVGERSYGKGSVQNQRPLANGLVLRQTIARFYLPSGRTNQIEGVYPDLEAFSKPNPTENDKVAFREEDEYMALPKIGKKWVQPRPEVIAELQSCIESKGSAAQRFEEAQGNALAPDFQLMYAEDTLNCVVDLNLSGTNGTEIGNGWEKSASNQPSTPELDARDKAIHLF